LVLVDRQGIFGNRHFAGKKCAFHRDLSLGMGQVSEKSANTLYLVGELVF